MPGPDPDHRLWSLFDDLTRVETRLWNDLDRVLRAEAGVTLGDVNLLEVVVASERCRVQDVARALEISVGGASQAADRVVAKGLCVRAPDPSDRRASVLRASPAGESALAGARPVVEQGLAAAVSGLDAADVRMLRELLSRLRRGPDAGS